MPRPDVAVLISFQVQAIAEPVVAAVKTSTTAADVILGHYVPGVTPSILPLRGGFLSSDAAQAEVVGSSMYPYGYPEFPSCRQVDLPSSDSHTPSNLSRV